MSPNYGVVALVLTAIRAKLIVLRMQQLADVSGHLTPRTLEIELAKFDRKNCEVLLYHLKPAFVAQLKREVKHLPVQVLELGDTFDF